MLDIPSLISSMTLEEKASLCSGSDFWHTTAIQRLGIPSVMVSDGPHGLRKQTEEADNLGVNDSIRAVCFPAACATASSFDRSLLEKMGEALGDCCQHEGVSVLLGPAVNIKRSPLCGRNFEYFSEDPYLAGQMATAFIRGVQSRNIGTSIKHFAANSQEHRRMSSSSNVDEKTLREIYLPAFETAVREAQPWTVMCSYNRLNGTFASEHPWLLTRVLREEWGFRGLVVSDWGAVSDRVAGLAAGMDLEMPGPDDYNDQRLVDAVREGRLDEAVLDEACRRILTMVDRYLSSCRPDTPWDLDAQHQLAADIASQSMVLLKNEGGLLPLDPEASIAFIGEFAQRPRFQGGGSSHINSFKVTSALDAAHSRGLKVRYARGYDSSSGTSDESLVAEAVRAASESDVAVIFAGLPDSYESEGYDRTHMHLPDSHNRLIEAVREANPRTVVVLHNGSPVELPWANRIPAILEAYLGGQAVGEATLRILLGEVNPSGHLAESFPLRLCDNPSYLYYGGNASGTDYREGIFVGYRYYDKKEMDVLFPFGHGLSYTTFSLSDLHVDRECLNPGDVATASLTVTNTGSRAGAAVVQIYVSETENPLRPLRELKGFDKCFLQPGESRQIRFALDFRSFATWDSDLNTWQCASRNFVLSAGFSSRDLHLSCPISVEPVPSPRPRCTLDTIFLDIKQDPQLKEIFLSAIKELVFFRQDKEESAAAKEAITDEMNDAMMDYMPLRGILSFGSSKVTQKQIDDLLNKLNS